MMQEQEQFLPSPGQQPASQEVGVGPLGSGVDTSGVEKRITGALGGVRVISGANDETFEGFSGRTVKSIRKSLKEVMNIPNDAEAIVNNENVNDEFVIGAGETLEFVKRAGVKG